MVCPPSSQFATFHADVVDNSPRGFAYIEFEEAADAEEAIFNMHDSELYGRVIKVDVAKPHKGAAGLDPTLPGMTSSLSVLIDSLETGGMDQGEFQCRWEWSWTGSGCNAGVGDDFTGIMMDFTCAIRKWMIPLGCNSGICCVNWRLERRTYW